MRSARALRHLRLERGRLETRMLWGLGALLFGLLGVGCLLGPVEVAGVLSGM